MLGKTLGSRTKMAQILKPDICWIGGTQGWMAYHLGSLGSWFSAHKSGKDPCIRGSNHIFAHQKKGLKGLCSAVLCSGRQGYP